MNYANIKKFKNYFKSQISYYGYKNSSEDESDIDESYICVLINTNLRYYKTIWLVEGKQDVVFYGKLCNKMVDNPIFLYATSSDGFKQLVGKQNVLNSYMLINNNKTLGRNMNRYVFMVDHDYDGIDYYQPKLNSRYERFSEKDKKNISVTRGYSFENYITTEDNIDKIFEIVCDLKGLNKDYEIRKFNKKYENFKKEINEFFSWVACIVYATKNNYIRRNLGLIKIDDIFNYDFSTEEIYNKDLLKEALKQRKNIVFENTAHLKKEIIDELKREQKKYYNLIVEKNYIQGHTLYNFLVAYFDYYFKFDLRIDLKNEVFINEVLNNLNIKFSINLGNGKRIGEAI